MAERTNARLLKSRGTPVPVGSNPTPSADRRWHLPLAGALVPALVVAMMLLAGPPNPAGASTPARPRVLLVGTYKGIRGQFTSIQSAVDAARPGDWILIGPGDYHETGRNLDDPTPDQLAHGDLGAVLITTPRVHLRGMSRGGVVVDGTRAGAPRPCDPSPQWQQTGPLGPGSQPTGRNGIVVWKANGVTIQNLTACNFLGGDTAGGVSTEGVTGEQIWWNGGYESGHIGLRGYSGSYLTTTSTYFDTESTAAEYGVGVANAAGPGALSQVYGSNMNDAGIGLMGCQDACGTVIAHAWSEYNALGYDASNSGGVIVIEDSRFDHDRDGVDTNTSIGPDPPAPQSGRCPRNGVSPITHTHSCWVFVHNDVEANNNADAPSSGQAANVPTGTGLSIAGGRDDTVMDNHITGNGAWGALFVPFPDDTTPTMGQTCAGAGGTPSSALGCIFDAQADALVGNTFSDNGFFKNPSNGDYGQIVLSGGQRSNCFSGNSAPDGSAPADLEVTHPVCGSIVSQPDTGGTLFVEALCDAGYGSCPPGADYPTSTGVQMHSLPTDLPTMPNPCAGVPANRWCRS